MALTQIKTTGIADNAVTDAKVADAITVTGAQAGITQVGTLTAGVWQGTAIASAYLDSDTAHLSGTQTFSGDKTFSGETTFSGFLNDTKIYNHLKFVASDGTTVHGGVRGASNSVEIRTGSSTTVACTFDGSQNATFAGTVRSTDVFYGNDNGASNPGFRFYNAASGMYHAGSDNLGFAVSGNNVATLTASSASFSGQINQAGDTGAGAYAATFKNTNSTRAGGVKIDTTFNNSSLDEPLLAVRMAGTDIFNVSSNGTSTFAGNIISSGNIEHDGTITTDITTNNTGHDFRLHADNNYANSIDNFFDGASADSSFMRIKVAGGAGVQNTVVTMDGSGNAAFESKISAPLFQSGNQATSVANGTWTNLNGLTNLSVGLYIIHAFKDNYAANDWSARGIVEATGHSTIDGDFENQSGFQLRVDGNDVQLYHTLGQTFGITVAWLRIA